MREATIYIKKALRNIYNYTESGRGGSSLNWGGVCVKISLLTRVVKAPENEREIWEIYEPKITKTDTNFNVFY